MRLTYTKMHGCGNDFIMVDGRSQLKGVDLKVLAAQLCDRRRGLGADGLIVLRDATGKADFAMRYINASGMPGEMCGNGARCAARFAHDLGIVHDQATFTTGAGLVTAHVRPADVVIKLAAPRDIRLDEKLLLAGREAVVHYALVGVPHGVTIVDDVKHHPVDVEGPLLRHHPTFPKGCNANFIAFTDAGIAVRTFERGVEAETLACGTGSVASASIGYLLGRTGLVTTILTHGGDRLTVTLISDGKTLTGATLAGATETVARGEIDAGYATRHGLA